MKVAVYRALWLALVLAVSDIPVLSRGTMLRIGLRRTQWRWVRRNPILNLLTPSGYFTFHQV